MFENEKPPMYNENGSSAVSLNKGGCPVDNNSLSHTTWNCKYHIVFAMVFEIFKVGISYEGGNPKPEFYDKLLKEG